MTEDHIASLNARMVQRDQGSGLSTLSAVDQAELNRSLNHISALTAKLGGTDARDERIAKLEAEIERLSANVRSYDAAFGEMLTLMRNRNVRIANLRTERDMLAKRLQQVLAERTVEPEPDPVFAAIDALQRQGVR